MYGQKDSYIILPLRGFDPVTCGRMRCAQLRAARMIANKRRGRPDKDTERRTDERMDRWKYNLDWTPLGSFVPHCGNNIRVKQIYAPDTNKVHFPQTDRQT